MSAAMRRRLLLYCRTSAYPSAYDILSRVIDQLSELKGRFFRFSTLVLDTDHLRRYDVLHVMLIFSLVHHDFASRP